MWGDFLAKIHPRKVIFSFYMPHKLKNENITLLKNTEKQCFRFDICWTLPIAAKLSLVNFFEKMGGTWFNLAGRCLG